MVSERLPRLFWRAAFAAACVCPTFTSAFGAEPAWWTEQKRACGLPSGLAYNTWVQNGSPCNRGSATRSSPSAPNYDYEAERRQREEQERVENERRADEARSKAQAEFIRDRDATVPLLRGSAAAKGPGSGELRGSSPGLGAVELRGSGGAQAEADAGTVDRIIDEMIGVRRQELEYRKKMIKVWQTAQRAVERGENTAAQLESWAKESQTAQQEALTAAIELLTGPAMDYVIQRQITAGSPAWVDIVREKRLLKEARAQMTRYRRVWKKYQALTKEIADLEAKVAAAEATLQHTVNVGMLAETIKDLGKGTLKIVKMASLIPDPRAKHDLLGAMAELHHASVELLKSAGLSELIETARGTHMPNLARGAELAKFAANYSAAAAKFGVAWWQINMLLERVDDRTRLLAGLGLNLHQEEARRRALATEIQELERARRGSPDEKQETLRVFRARETQLAIEREGLWTTSGTRAPGQPIR